MYLQKKKIKALEKLTETECYCDTEHPWEKCVGCKAAKVLNDCADIMRNGYKEIKGEL